MLEDAFKMMGEEKDGVIKVHKEAERKLKVMQQEYEVFILEICNKNMRVHFQIGRENPFTLLYVACPGFKRREGEACEERQELGGQVQAVPGRDGQASGNRGRSPFRQEWEWIDLIDHY